MPKTHDHYFLHSGECVYCASTLEQTTQEKTEMNAQVGMLNVNTEKALKLAARLERNGFKYVCPLSPVTDASPMVSHLFSKRDELGNIVEHARLNERANGYHNITN